ncbi:hypothetical protein RUM44_006648 [Polyplax serrata]|uniref:BTB domain-containing protein n=1 Tax=Polyplax serrata TaxID=468196 RepID=A0ABR1AK86_POLSC
MTKLMTDISYSDIIIATADKHMIYSHRFVLANSSKYFQRLLKNMKRQREIQLVVALPEIKYDIFKILMNYMYKGETQVPHELLPSVIKAGQFLEINGLVNLSESESGGGGGSGSGSNASIMKFSSSSGDQHPTRSSIIHTSNFAGTCHGSTSQEVQKKREREGNPSSTLRDKVHSRENAANCTKTVFRPEKRTRMDKHSAESPENGKENRGKLAKSSKAKASTQDNVDFIQLPLKRKSFLRDRDSVKKTSLLTSPSSSMSSDSALPKKSQKRQATAQEVISISVKSEKESDESPQRESKSDEVEDLEDKITIKEEPDDIEEVEYNELQCEFCHEVYTNPSDWVKHMTEQHEDRGYQTYKDLDKSGGGNAVITCVVCSCVCFSAAEWANHLRMWHTERELAVANMTDPKKSGSKVKKKSGEENLKKFNSLVTGSNVQQS